MAQSSPKLRAGLPSKYIVRTVKWIWTTLWQMMMAKLAPRSPSGAYIRPESEFRHDVKAEADSVYRPEAGRYRLIVGLGCPWAHRTLVVRAIKGLDAAIPLYTVSPSPDEGFWVFVSDLPADLQQELQGGSTLPEFYRLAQPGYGGRSTVPVLWDTQTRTIVNNESAEIIVMLNSEFNEVAQRPDVDLYPDALQEQIDAWNTKIYGAVNNGVYRCGFAQTQAAYDEACSELFATLDEIDAALATSRYLCGDRPTLADVRLFTTLFRFDIVYYGLFKCNRRRIRDYQHLGPYLRDLYQLPGVAGTCNLEAIKRDYYGNLFPLNPGGIIPQGPDMGNLFEPHHREQLSPTPVG